MAEALQSVKECVKRLWNTKNNVPQHQIAKALQISSSTVHNIIKRFRETGEMDKAGDLCWMSVVFRPSDDTASLIGVILSLTLLNGPRVGKHNPPCHLQMPTKALSCKKEAICEHGPEVPSCPVGQGSFKMDCFKVEKSSMVRQVQI